MIPKGSKGGKGERELKLKIPQYFFKAIEQKAKLDELSVNDFALQALEFYYCMNKELLYNAKKLAPGFKATPADVVSNAAITAFSLNAATIEIYGQPLDMFKRLFVYEKEDGKALRLISGNELFFKLKNDFEKKLEAELAEQNKANK
jgi:hypothetical protein